MFKTLLRMLFGDPYAFRRVDYPGFSDHELPKKFQDIDRKSMSVRRRQLLNKQIKHRGNLTAH